MRLLALLGGLVGVGLLACSAPAAREPDQGPVGRREPGNRALDRTLVVGTLVEATIDSSPDTLTATVSADVRNAHRWVVIAAGCPVGLRIALWGPALDKSQGADANVLVGVISVTVRGQVYAVHATVELAPVAFRRASREAVVVAPGTRILFVLPEGLTVDGGRDETPHWLARGS